MGRGNGYVKCDLFEVGESLIPCHRMDCHHHFSWGMKFGKYDGAPRGFTETKESRKSLNCMCLLKEPLSQTEISEMFGATHQEISLIEKNATQHFYDML
jgi:hypothetical protein